MARKGQPSPDAEQAAVLVELANMAMFGSRFDEARAWLERAEPVFAALGDTDLRVLRPGAEDSRKPGAPGQHAGPRAGAALLERSTALFRERYPESDGRLGALFYLAQTLRSSNVPGRAEAIADEAVEWRFTVPAVGLRAGPTRYSLRAVIRDSNGKLAEAEADFRRAHEGYLQTIGPDPLPHPAEPGAARRDPAGDRRVAERRSGTSRPRRGAGPGAAREPHPRTGGGAAGPGLPSRGPVRAGRRGRSRRPARCGPSAARRCTAAAPTLALAEARAALGQDAQARALLDEALTVLQGARAPRSPRGRRAPRPGAHRRRPRRDRRGAHRARPRR